MKLKVVYLVFSILFSNVATSQVRLLDSLLENKQYSTFNYKINVIDLDSNSYHYYLGKLYLQKRNIDSAFSLLKKVDTTQLTKPYKAWYFHVLGDTYRYQNREERAFQLKIKAQELFKETSNLLMENKVNYDLHYTLFSQDFLDYDGRSYLMTFFENAKKNDTPEQLLTAHLSFCFMDILPNNLEKAIFHLDEASKYANMIGTPEAFYKVNNYKAVFLQSYADDYTNAEIHADSMIHYAEILKSPDRMDSSLKTKAYNYTLQGDYEKAIQILKKADALPIAENIFNRKKQLYQYLSINYENLNDFKSSHLYLKKMISYKDSINIVAQNTVLTQLETIELSKKNLILKAEKQKQKMYLYTSIIGLMLIIILTIFMSMYYRKKKELDTIDARNEEKDKQRQRIAGELHDDLGGLIIAIRRCFENLKIRKDRFLQEEESLILTARSLLEEVYQKIRNMAHVEDSASRRSEYWLDSIHDFANNVTEASKLNIDISTHGLEDFVNVSLENDLRRISVELITNILKYADAKEVTIEIILRDKIISILVEDDGNGFDTSKLKNTKGIGLRNIKKKVEELKGTLNIDSLIHKGTTIIIEIPV
ncbi:tetratricopeptide repeat-containing sensor histidine kinase [Winogradskyella sp.]|uniref:tetratricopeptide repeat-containing sensor histidine kinase n=1 Tax=Winogradskyella sp. TaxID=1883156 RepID=UPI003BAADFB2